MAGRTTASPSAGLRLADGAIAEDLQLPGVGEVPVRYSPCAAGWTVRFVLTGDDGLSVEHRLVAPSVREARRAVPAAVAFLLGEPVDGAPAR